MNRPESIPMTRDEALQFISDRETTITWTKDSNLLITDKSGRIVHHSPSWIFTAQKLATMYEQGFDVRYAMELEKMIRVAVQSPRTSQLAIGLIKESTEKFQRLLAIPYEALRCR